MEQLIKEMQENLLFFLSAAAIMILLGLVARLAEFRLPCMRRTTKTKRLCVIAISAAIAAVLHIFDFSLPFLAPEF